MRAQLRALATATAIFSASLSPAAAVGDEVATDVPGALSSLETWLGKGPTREGWAKYLDLNVLVATQAKGEKADPAVVGHVIERLDSGAPGLDKPRFRKLRAALAAWRDELAVAQAPALPDAVLQAESRFHPVTAGEVAAAKTALAESVGKLDAYLAKSGANGEGWRVYLKWPVLKEQLAAAKPDGEALGGVYRQFSADQKGLELPVFANVAAAMESYLNLLASETEDLKAKYVDNLKALAAELKDYAANHTEDLAVAVGGRLGWLDRTRQALAVVRAVRNRYSQPNLMVAASERLVGAGIAQPVDDTGPVRDYILGTSISGTGHTLGQVTLDLVPSEDHATLETVLVGKTDTRSVGHNGPATIYTTGTAKIAGRKRIVIDADGVHGLPATGTAKVNSQINGISARCGLVEKIATRKAGKSKGEAEMIAGQHAGVRVRERVDAQAGEQLAKAQADYLDKFRNPLVRRREFPSLLKFRTTADQLYLTALQANRDQLAAPGEAPQVDGEFDLVVRLHESMINNLASALLAGVTVKEEEMQKQVIELRGELPDELKSEADRDPWSITFANSRPISIKFSDNGFQVTVRGQRYTSGDREFRAMHVTADYKVEHVGNGARLVRQGDLLIVPPNFVQGQTRLSTQQITLRTLLQKRFGKLFKEEVKYEGLELPGQWAKAGRLDLKHLNVNGGWAALAWLESGEPVKPKPPKPAAPAQDAPKAAQVEPTGSNAADKVTLANP